MNHKFCPYRPVLFDLSLFSILTPGGTYLEILDKCVRDIRHNNVNNQIVISADVNALSASWFSRTTDERGDKIEEFITDNDLVILNQASRFTTYASSSGQTST